MNNISEIDKNKLINSLQRLLEDFIAESNKDDKPNHKKSFEKLAWKLTKNRIFDSINKRNRQKTDSISNIMKEDEYKENEAIDTIPDNNDSNPESDVENSDLKEQIEDFFMYMREKLGYDIKD